MTIHEEFVLYLVQDRVTFMMENNFDNNYIASYIDDVIAKLPSVYSRELFSILYRIQDNLLMYKEDYIWLFI